MPKISFHFLDVSLTLSNRIKLKSFIQSVFNNEKQPLSSLSYIFCTDDYLLGINKQFLNHDTYTDIVTFTLSNPKQPIEGEIYISVDRVKENANTHKTILPQELHRVIFHGALHLCGYTDKTKTAKVEMRQMEDRCLDEYFK
jgi:probable rRNA maturation factor